MRPRFATLATCLVFVTVSMRARADEGAARELFQRGVALYDAREYGKALEVFRASYAERPSYVTKQNIALSLKGLGRLPEAAAALDEALDEGGASMKREARAALEAELAELSKSVATLHLSVVDSGGRPLRDAIITVDGADLPPGASTRPARLTPGIHVLSARLASFAPPPEKRLALLAGAPVDATFLIDAALEPLTLRVRAPEAVVRVDGEAPVGGEWTWRVTRGPHRVEIAAPGYRDARFELNVGPGGLSRDVDLEPMPDLPGEYRAPERRPPKLKRFYLVPAVSVAGAQLRLSSAFAEPVDNGMSRTFGGASLGMRGGLWLGRHVGLELHADFGTLSARYRADATAGGESEARASHWQLTPVLRFATRGRVRFTVAAGLGLRGTVIEGDVWPSRANLSSPIRLTREGSATGAAWLQDVALQIDLGQTVFLEPGAFLDVHGVGAVRDDATGDRLLLGSPAIRYGARLGVGVAL